MNNALFVENRLNNLLRSYNIDKVFPKPHLHMIALFISFKQTDPSNLLR